MYIGAENIDIRLHHFGEIIMARGSGPAGRFSIISGVDVFDIIMN